MLGSLLHVLLAYWCIDTCHIIFKQSGWFTLRKVNFFYLNLTSTDTGTIPLTLKWWKSNNFDLTVSPTYGSAIKYQHMSTYAWGGPESYDEMLFSESEFFNRHKLCTWVYRVSYILPGSAGNIHEWSNKLLIHFDVLLDRECWAVIFAEYLPCNHRCILGLQSAILVNLFRTFLM